MLVYMVCMCGRVDGPQNSVWAIYFFLVICDVRIILSNYHLEKISLCRHLLERIRTKLSCVIEIERPTYSSSSDESRERGKQLGVPMETIPPTLTILAGFSWPAGQPVRNYWAPAHNGEHFVNDFLTQPQYVGKRLNV